jgi:hypothetical protein
LKKLFSSLCQNLVTTCQPTEVLLGSTFTQAERIIFKKMALFESTKKRPENLGKLFKALKTIPPSSIEAERAFSTAGIFITKLRNRLSAKTINALIFFEAFLLKK